MPHVLLIDDDPQYQASFCERYDQNFKVTCMSSPREILTNKDFDARRFCLFLVDIHIPGASGFEVIDFLHQRVTTSQKILALSYDESTEKKILALKVGASDYLWKSMNEEEFFLRVCRAIDGYAFDLPFKLETAYNTVSIENKDIQLTPIEFRILENLSRTTSTATDKLHLIERVWPNREVSAQTLNTHIFNINQKLQRYGTSIKIDRKNRIQLQMADPGQDAHREEPSPN